MNKYISQILLISFFAATLFSFNALAPVAKATTIAPPVSTSELIELLISIGAIAPDKVVAARAMITPSGLLATSTVGKAVISTSTAYIQILSPNSADTWTKDTDVPYSITWGSAGINQAYVALVPNTAKPVVCNLSPTPVSSKDGEHSFKIYLNSAKCYNLTLGTSTPLLDGSYKARVYYTGSNGVMVMGENSAVFKILPIPNPSIKITYPNGAEKLVKNKSYDIKYTLKDITESLDGLIHVYLLDNNDNIAYNTKAVLKGGVVSVTFPNSVVLGAYKIKLDLNTKKHVLIEDVSDNFFWISDPQ